MTVNCPTCDNGFKSEHAMRIHHSHKHNESIAGVETVCKKCSSKFRTSKDNYKNRDMDFCSRECYADWLSENRNGEDHPNYDGGYDYPYNGIWMRKRREAIKRDFERCRMCRLKRSECKRKYDIDLHVHHKTSITNFENVDKAHQLYNLITLCPDCHDYVEYGRKVVNDEQFTL